MLFNGGHHLQGCGWIAPSMLLCGEWQSELPLSLSSPIFKSKSKLPEHRNDILGESRGGHWAGGTWASWQAQRNASASSTGTLYGYSIFISLGNSPKSVDRSSSVTLLLAFFLE